MHITIEGVTGDGSVVRFTHDGGTADGIWLGAEPPQLGPVLAELSVPGRFWWQDDVRIVSAEPGSSASRGHPSQASGGAPDSLRAHDGMTIRGRAVAVDAQAGVLSLQFGDGIVRIDTSGPVPPGVVGTTVEVDSPLLELTPIGA